MWAEGTTASVFPCEPDINLSYKQFLYVLNFEWISDFSIVFQNNFLPIVVLNF